MKGATAEPWLSTINVPKSAKTIIIGNNQYFFLSFKNSQNSFKKLNLECEDFSLCVEMPIKAKKFAISN